MWGRDLAKLEAGASEWIKCVLAQELVDSLVILFSNGQRSLDAALHSHRQALLHFLHCERKKQ